MPGICSGTGYLLTKRVAGILFKELLPMETYLKIHNEDVLFTGIIRKKAGLRLLSDHKRFRYMSGPRRCGEREKFAITLHSYGNPDTFMTAWKSCNLMENML
jgi:hypothetical protein